MVVLLVHLLINKIDMLQNMYIAYLRGFEGKPKPKYIKGSLVEKWYNYGASDRKNNLPNRHLKEKHESK